MRTLTSFVLTSLLLTGCAAYHPLPLDPSSVAQQLKPPSRATLQRAGLALNHPLLQPVAYDDRDGLSLNEIALLAVVANPMLRALRDQRGIATAQLLQAGILPNPQLSYSFDFPTGGTTLGTVEAFGVGANWEPTALIARHAKIEAAQAQAASVDLDIAWQEWQIAQAAKLQALRVMSGEQQLQVAHEIENGFQDNLAAVTHAVKLGDLTAIDQTAAETAFQQARLARLSLEQEQHRQQLALNQTVGLPVDASVQLPQHLELPGWPILPAEQPLVEELAERRLDLLALKRGYDSQEATVRAVILSQFPKISLGFVEARDTGNVATSGLAITVDVPIFDHNQGQIALEQATRQQLFDEYSARLFTATGDVVRALTDMASTKQQIHAAEAFLVNLRALVHLYNTAVLEGNVDILSYYTARNTLATQQIELLKLKQTLAELGIALEIAAGRYFPGAEASASPPGPGLQGGGETK